MFVCSCSLLLYGGFRNQYHGGHEEILVPLLMIGNIIFLTFLVCLADGIRRKLVIEKPVKEILEAVEQISRGNFGYRAPVLHSGKRRNEFDLILEGINQMAEELGNVETLQTDFISNVSHELKTPLAVIQNYASVLGSRGLEEEQRKEYTVTIVDTARRLSGLVTNILRLNRLENQEIYPKAQKYPLGEQLRCCILAFEEKWEEKELEVEADIEDLDLFGDEELLEIVWNNLISNAIKFTGQGEPSAYPCIRPTILQWCRWRTPAAGWTRKPDSIFLTSFTREIRLTHRKEMVWGLRWCRVVDIVQEISRWRAGWEKERFLPCVSAYNGRRETMDQKQKTEEGFSYTYSAKENQAFRREVEEIQARYETETSRRGRSGTTAQT